MPEYNNMKRLDYFANHLSDWCLSRIRSPQGHDLLRRLFVYDPESRLTAREALQHKWFQEEPCPTWKYVHHPEILNNPNNSPSCIVLLRACWLIKSHHIEESPRTKLPLWSPCPKIHLTKEDITLHPSGNRIRNLRVQIVFLIA